MFEGGVTISAGAAIPAISAKQGLKQTTAKLAHKRGRPFLTELNPNFSVEKFPSQSSGGLTPWITPRNIAAERQRREPFGKFFSCTFLFIELRLKTHGN